jgi:alkylhydroperoxidase/carboxymuconolactone decarboxylase family protein YurZ
MAISAAAKGNHDQLFGDRVSTLAQFDPELTEYFGNFAFDEVYADAARLDETLDLHTRLMVQLAAILAAGGLAEFRVVAAAAVAKGGVSPVELKEIVYQSVAYVGMARAFDYLHAVNDLLTEAGVELPLPGRSASTPQTRLEYGKRCRAASSATTRWPLASRAPQRMRCTSSATWPLTASATPSGAVALTWRCASCSRSRCSSPWAVQTLRCAGTSTGTSGSATPARGCSPC